MNKVGMRNSATKWNSEILHICNNSSQFSFNFQGQKKME